MFVDELLDTSMNFKNWLIEEGEFINTGFFLYPTVADDYNDVTQSARHFQVLQHKWDAEKNKLKFHNIDVNRFLDREFTNVSSTTLPEVGEGKWEHKPDDGSESSVEVDKMGELSMYGISKSPHKIDVDPIPDDVSLDYGIDSLFGDKPSGKYPEIDEKEMDKAWRKKYEAYMAEYGGAATSGMHGGIQNIPGEFLNTNLPVRSKISTSDGVPSNYPPTGKKIKDPDKSFGFKTRKSKKDSKERRSKTIDKKGRRVPITSIPPDVVY